LPTPVTEQSLRIGKLVYGGDGLTRIDGRVILTPFVLPGELVQAEVQPAKKDLLRGRPIEILEPSPERVTPRCPYFLRCGGCHYQHASYEFEAEQKRSIFREVLRRVGRIEYDGEIELVTADPWQYRNRTQLHIHNGEIGYFAAGSRTLVPIRECPVSSPKINEAIASLARDLPSYRWFDASIELFTNESEIQVNPVDRVPASVLPLFDAIGGKAPIDYGGFRVSRNSFFQVNRFLLEKLVATALADAHGSTAVDLYAGVGLFARSMAGRFESVTAVESGASAFHDLEFNMQGHPVQSVRGNAEDYLASLTAPPGLVVADPPRAGLGKPAIGELIRLMAPAVTIVSCDPATLARDLAPLLENGYRLAGVTVVDLFPRTFHLESVISLKRN
jgi:23S rRNA (uracil1939-C5)-methyltransferase